MKATTAATSKKRRRGRPKAVGISVTARKQISALKIRLHLGDSVLTYRDVADQLTFRAGFRVSAATVWKLAHGTEPRSPRLRQLFGLPVLIPAPACACGEVHVRRGRCPNAPKPQPPAWVTAAADLLAARERLTPPAVRVYGRGGKAVTW